MFHEEWRVPGDVGVLLDLISFLSHYDCYCNMYVTAGCVFSPFGV